MRPIQRKLSLSRETLRVVRGGNTGGGTSGVGGQGAGSFSNDPGNCQGTSGVGTNCNTCGATCSAHSEGTGCAPTQCW